MPLPLVVALMPRPEALWSNVVTSWRVGLQIGRDVVKTMASVKTFLLQHVKVKRVLNRKRGFYWVKWFLTSKHFLPGKKVFTE